jgi:hypothetical protein
VWKTFGKVPDGAFGELKDCLISHARDHFIEIKVSDNLNVARIV